MDLASWLPGSLRSLEDWQLGAALFYTVTFGILVYLALKIRRDLILARVGARADGRIVGIQEGEDSDYPVVQFTDRLGRVHKFNSELPQRGGTVPVGSAIGVLYDPMNPRRARTTGRPLGRVGFYALYLFIASIAAWAAISATLDGLR